MRVMKREWRRKLKASSAAAAIAVLAGAAAHPAAAQTRQQPQNVLEALFPQLIQERVARERAFEQQQRQAAPAPIAKVTGPQYYTYKTDKLARIDLSKVAAPAAPAQAAPAAAAEPALEARIEQVVLGGAAADAPVSAGADAMMEQVERARREAFASLVPHLNALDMLAEPEIAKAVSEFYRNNPRLLWLSVGLAPNARASNALSVLADSGRYGLDPVEYAVEAPSGNQPDEQARLAAASRFEVALTARAVRYMLDAEHGVVDPNRISGYHDFPKRKRDAAGALEKLASGLPSTVMLAAHPQNLQFKALVAELENLKSAVDDTIVIPEGTLIKPGEAHEQVANVVAAIGRRGSQALRDQFAAVLSPAVPHTSFTPEVVELVKAYQKEVGLGADGVVGRNTIARLSGLGVDAKRERVEMAMEQLRWHPRELGSRHVFINVPAYTARYVEGGQQQFEMRVVVGTKANQTSFFHDTIETVEYNPYWGIPQSILVNEYLGKLRENPNYLDERGYEVTDNSGQVIPSAAIDWWSMTNSVPYNVRQKPGEANALGELKILFPNKHAIYMHDTPAKSLFSRDMRAYSHGCVRLAEPRKMAAAVLGKSIGHVEGMLAQGHGQEEVPQGFPVYVAYFTAFPDAEGKVEYFADIYARDEALRKAIAAVLAQRSSAG